MSNNEFIDITRPPPKFQRRDYQEVVKASKRKPRARFAIAASASLVLAITIGNPLDFMFAVSAVALAVLYAQEYYYYYYWLMYALDNEQRWHLMWRTLTNHGTPRPESYEDWYAWLNEVEESRKITDNTKWAKLTTSHYIHR